jgi:hypothetical protein
MRWTYELQLYTHSKPWPYLTNPVAVVTAAACCCLLLPAAACCCCWLLLLLQIRRYGFHGTSHKYLVSTAASMLGKSPQQTNAITCHLGASHQ